MGLHIGRAGGVSRGLDLTTGSEIRAHKLD